MGGHADELPIVVAPAQRNIRFPIRYVATRDKWSKDCVAMRAQSFVDWRLDVATELFDLALPP
jgi:hypothetical protein